MANDVSWSPLPDAETAMATSPPSGDSASENAYKLSELFDIDVPSEPPSYTREDQHIHVPGSLTSTASWSGAAPPSGDTSSESGSYSSSSETSESSDDEADVPLQYSRKYRMTEDYLIGSPLESDLIPYPPETIDADLLDLPGGVDIESSSTAVRDALRERLDVDKETITFLADIAALDKPLRPESNVDVEYLMRKQKIELPILREDHDLQLRRAHVRNKLELTSRNMELFVLGADADEGPEFPLRVFNEKQALDKATTDERWDVSQETMEYLRNLMKMLNETVPDIEYRASSGAVTPPLLPMSPPLTPGIPDGEAMQIDFTSTPEDLIALDAVTAAEAVLAEDAEFVNNLDNLVTNTDDTNTSDWSLPKSISARPSSSSPMGKKRLRNLKLDLPLLPADVVESPAKRAKKVSFPAELASLIPDPANDGSPGDVEYDGEKLEDFMEKVLQPFADSVVAEIESEKLSEVDTTMRVKVPKLDPVQVREPWAEYASLSDAIPPLQAQRALLQYARRELLKDEQKWGGVSKLERALPWKPFPPHLGKIDSDEHFDDGSLHRYMAELNLEAEIDPFQLVAQHTTLQILQHREEDDEELEPFHVTEYPAPAAIVSLDSVKGAPRQCGAITGGSQSDHKEARMAKSGAVVPTPTDSWDLFLAKLNRVSSEQATEAAPKGPADIEKTTATATNILREDGLSAFMRLQGKPLASIKAPAVLPTVAKPTAAPAAVMTPPIALPAQPAKLAVPETTVRIDAPISIVVSPTFMANRTQVRALQAALPKLELVERAPLSAVSQTGKTVTLEEPDITLSPSTGLVLTTLQKIKQRALPGQTDFGGVRERIMLVAAQYERLIVFVSEANSSETPARDLDDRDAEAVSDLIAFTGTIDRDVQITYIPGSDSDVTAWTAAAVSTYGVVDGSVTLLQDETLWERFLRRAGLNAFAAQGILGQLKRAGSATGTSGHSSVESQVTGEEWSGLAAFVCMSVEERVQRFGAQLGGDRLLRRISRAVDGKW